MPFDAAGVSGREFGWSAPTLPAIMKLPKCVTLAAGSLTVFFHSFILLIQQMASFTRRLASSSLASSTPPSFTLFLSWLILKMLLLNNFIVTQASFYPAKYGVKFDPSKFGQFNHFELLSFKRNKYSAISIPLLLFSGSPFAIVAGIPSVVILALKRVALRPWPHVFNKLFEIVLPFWANVNSSSPVIFILFSRFILTTRAHSFPNAVEWVRTSHGGLNMLMPFTATGKQNQLGCRHGI